VTTKAEQPTCTLCDRPLQSGPGAKYCAECSKVIFRLNQRHGLGSDLWHYHFARYMRYLEAVAAGDQAGIYKLMPPTGNKQFDAVLKVYQIATVALEDGAERVSVPFRTADTELNGLIAILRALERAESRHPLTFQECALYHRVMGIKPFIPSRNGKEPWSYQAIEFTERSALKKLRRAFRRGVYEEDRAMEAAQVQ